MAKLRETPISSKDLQEFIESESDFAFEMRCLARLRELGFDCSHAGTYRDPVTGKVRQFDIRAVLHKGKLTLALAVECKNFRENHPLLVSAVPRTAPESFTDLIRFKVDEIIYRQEVRPCTGNASVYPEGEMVGKEIDQVGRDTTGTLVGNDQTTFEKLNQAVNSCRDLVRHFATKSTAPTFRAIVPVLVVPPQRLWQVEYNLDGIRVSEPHSMRRTSLFLNHTWDFEVALHHIISYRLSHVDFVAFDALEDIVSMYFGPAGLCERL